MSRRCQIHDEGDKQDCRNEDDQDETSERGHVFPYQTPSAGFQRESHTRRSERPFVPPFKRLVTSRISSFSANGRQPHRMKSATPHSSAWSGETSHSRKVGTSTPRFA